MSDTWEQQIRIRSCDVTCDRLLRLSTLLKYIQEATVRHTTMLGMGRDKTLDKGLLWVITQQYLAIRRLPGYDEEIKLKTWPGSQLHLFFPRCTSIVDKDDEEIISARTMWILMDEKSRRPVFPDRYDVHIEGSSKPGDFPLPRVGAPGKGDRLLLKAERTALFSECDINGHINNSEYFDLYSDLMQEYSMKILQKNSDAASRLQPPLEIFAEYTDEVPYGSRYLAELYQSDRGFLIQGTSEGKALFKIRLKS